MRKTPASPADPNTTSPLRNMRSLRLAACYRSEVEARGPSIGCGCGAGWVVDTSDAAAPPRDAVDRCPAMPWAPVLQCRGLPSCNAVGSRAAMRWLGPHDAVGPRHVEGAGHRDVAARPPRCGGSCPRNIWWAPAVAMLMLPARDVVAAASAMWWAAGPAAWWTAAPAVLLAGCRFRAVVAAALVVWWLLPPVVLVVLTPGLGAVGWLGCGGVDGVAAA